MSPLSVLRTRPNSVRWYMPGTRNSKFLFPPLRTNVSPKAGYIHGLALGCVTRRHSCFLFPPPKPKQSPRCTTEIAMAQLHTRTQTKECRLNGNGVPHDRDHNDQGHSHSHSIFGHSHSHNGENGHGHSHDAEHIVAALRGDKREILFTLLALLSAYVKFPT